MLNFNMDDGTKKLYEQYDVDQEILKSNQKKEKLSLAHLKSLSKTAGSILSIFGLSGGIVGYLVNLLK